MVYKLVECKGKPTMKLSEEVEKTTLPCVKKVWRLWIQGTSIDVISTYQEKVSENEELRAVNLKKPNERYILKPSKVEELLIPVFMNGNIVVENVTELE